MKGIDAINSMPNDFRWNNNMSLTAEQLIKQYGLTIDDIKMLPLVERHRWGVSDYVNASENETEDPQKMLEIQYLNGVEKEMAIDISNILHRFHLQDEDANDGTKIMYNLDYEKDVRELNLLVGHLLI